MTGRIWRTILGGALFLMLTSLAGATETLVLEGCLDGRGNLLRAVADPQQAVLVRTISQRGRPVIHFNPEVLPSLSANARLFFYAHQCARRTLPGNAADYPEAAAHQADCVALNTLLDNDQLKYKDIAGLQDELRSLGNEWKVLPGPARTVQLDNCRPTSGDVLRLPIASQPTAKQDSWNTCVRTCADRLWTCQKSCGSSSCATCQASYDSCRSGCGN